MNISSSKLTKWTVVQLQMHNPQLLEDLRQPTYQKKLSVWTVRYLLEHRSPVLDEMKAAI
jgi:hypothetical protein